MNNQGDCKITISVVIPVYNVAPYIRRCITSVMQQTLPATECIIVNDASTDDSLELCRQLIDGYTGSTRFVVLCHDRNRGISAARNTGTDAATSTHIYYLDSDDEMTPDCLEKMAAAIGNDDSIEMVMGGVRKDWSELRGRKAQLKQWLNIKWVNWQSKHIKRKNRELKGNDEVYGWYYQEGKKRTNTVWNRLLKLSFVKENNLYNKEGLLLEDRLWNYYLIRCLRHAIILPDVTYIYYRRPASIVASISAEKKRNHRGIIFREMADHVVLGERVEETKNRVKGFLQNYMRADGNEDYEYSFDVFLNQMVFCHQKKQVRQMNKARQRRERMCKQQTV